MHKSYHRTESQVSGGGLGEIKKLPLTATGTLYREMGKGEGVAVHFHEQSCLREFASSTQPVAGPSHQGRKQRRGWQRNNS